MTPDYHRLSIAPMMAYTDRHYRYMMRYFTKRCLLYTEMVVGSTIYHNLNNGLLKKVLKFHPSEHPLAVQLGGDGIEVMKTAARVCTDFGFDEINLNVGCPSNRVQKGRFGACLMREPERVAEVLAAMASVTHVPVTVKHRIGVDDLDQYEDLAKFTETVSKSGTQVFIVHARKAWLQGLSPAQNRNIPPLQYDLVYRLKRDFPHLTIVINGGIQDLQQTQQHLQAVDGVMIGRAAYYQPQLFARADEVVFGQQAASPPTAAAFLASYEAYANRELASGTSAGFVLKHLTGLFKGSRGARQWRQAITRLIQEKPGQVHLSEIYRKTVANSAKNHNTLTTPSEVGIVSS